MRMDTDRVDGTIPSSEAMPIGFIMGSQSYKNTIENESLAKPAKRIIGTIEKTGSMLASVDPSSMVSQSEAIQFIKNDSTQNMPRRDSRDERSDFEPTQRINEFFDLNDTLGPKILHQISQIEDEPIENDKCQN
jgi:hypothetical protein